MKKMCFPNWVKYNGGKYPPHTAFEVHDEDVADLQKAGGWVYETEPVAETVEEVKPTVKTTPKKRTTKTTTKQEG